MKRATNLFLLPRNLVSGLRYATQADDLMMNRTLINMLSWDVTVVVGVLVIYR
jgi:hypothetical protein